MALSRDDRLVSVASGQVVSKASVFYLVNQPNATANNVDLSAVTAVYSDSTGSTQVANPVLTNSKGFADTGYPDVAPYVGISPYTVVVVQPNGIISQVFPDQGETGSSSSSSSYLNVQEFGATGSGKHAWSINTTASSETVTLVQPDNFGPWFVNSEFTSSDVGAKILIYGAGTSNLTYVGIITAVISSTVATVSPAVPNTTEEAEAIWGSHDDGPAIQAAINATNAFATKVLIPNGVYLSSIAFTNTSAPFFYGIVGSGSLGSIIAITNTALNAPGLVIQDAPFAFEIGGFTLFGQGQLASTLTNAKGVWFSTDVQIPKERIHYYDMRVSQFPQIPMICECSIVSLFENSTCDNCGVAGFNFAPASGFAGTSTTVNNCYANNCGANGHLLNGIFYSTFNSCASDSNVIAYGLTSCTGLTFNSCGSESASGNPWDLNEVTSTTINDAYIEIDPAVEASQVMFNLHNNCADITINQPFAVINGDVTNAILIASNCAYTTIIHPILNNFSFTSAGPVTDLGYANLLIYDEFEDGLTFRTNDNQTYYNWACAGNDINIKNAFCGSLTPSFASAVTTGIVTFSGWGGDASLNYAEGSQTAFGIGINCLGTDSPLTQCAAAVTVSAGMSSIVSNGLTTTVFTALSPVPAVGGSLEVLGATNASNNGVFTILYSNAGRVVIANPDGVNETPPSYPTASAQFETATYTGTFASPYSHGDGVLIGGFTGGGNIGEFRVLSCNSTTLVVDNGGATNETASGTAWHDDQTANPTITVTYTTPFSVPPSPIVCGFLENDLTKNFVISSNTTTAITFTLIGTPINGDSYGLFCHIFNSF